ncbi:MAG: branched-chain amino acid ABC transporter permease [Gammaproteobacteria bacterium]|nr:branched-chain amino acid ABC transporter permease [Gammaproteobacteria bacterium]
MEQLLGFFLYLITVTCIFAMLAMSLDLQVGSCGLVNFGQVVFLCVGAYTTAIALDKGINPFLSVVLAMFVCTLVGLVLSLTVRNLSGTYWGILSLSLAEVVRLVMLNERWIADGANGLSVITTLPYFNVIVIGCTIFVYGLLRILVGSPFGRVIRMIREGDRLPQALGKNVLVFKMETMAIGGAIGGLAGALYAFLNSYISPDDCLPIETFIIWAMVILGGRGNVTGIILGTVIIQILFVGSRFLPNIVGIEPDTLSALRMVLIGALIMLVMMFRPEGALPERKRSYSI